MRILCIVGLCIGLASPAFGQNGTFVGTVARDTIGNVVARATVQLPQLNRVATTNVVGAFEFTNIPPGRYALTVKAIGFQLFVDTIEIKPGAHVDGDIVLDPIPVTLDAARTTASTVAKLLPPGIQEMEDRRKTHLGGYFVTDSMLRKDEDRKLTYFIAKFPGISQVLGTQTGGVFLATHRNQWDLGHGDGNAPGEKCYVDIWLNGAKYFIGPESRINPVPDFDTFWAREYSGIEFYPGGSTTPAQYGGTAGTCGTLLLWTRR